LAVGACRAGRGQRVQRRLDGLPAFGVEPPGDPDPPLPEGRGVQLAAFSGGFVLAFQFPAEDLITVFGVDDGEDPPADLGKDPRVVLPGLAEQLLLGRRGHPRLGLLRQLGDGPGDHLGVLGADLAAGQRLPGRGQVTIDYRSGEVGQLPRLAEGDPQQVPHPARGAPRAEGGGQLPPVGLGDQRQHDAAHHPRQQRVRPRQ